MSLLDKSASKDQLIDILNSMKFPIMGAGGGFAPIGAENYIEGTTAPEGWLICDGSVLNIADYPDLATYYASHYGASNHFGGDGITTFAVPTRSGMPYSNEGYSTSEKIIGVDNNRKPIYRKHITGLSVSLTSADSWQNITAISGADSLIDLKMYHYDSEIGFLQVYTRESELYDTIDCMIIVKGLIGVNRIVTDVIAEYTKGADSAVSLGHSADGNGVFCVKATVSGDPNGHVYSTEEQVVGTTEDGETIYEKTINLQNMAMNYSHPISFAKDVIDCKISIGLNQNQTIFANYYESSNYYIIFDIYDGSIRFNCKWSSYQTLDDVRIVLQYTKTSA